MRIGRGIDFPRLPHHSNTHQTKEVATMRDTNNHAPFYPDAATLHNLQGNLTNFERQHLSEARVPHWFARLRPHLETIAPVLAAEIQRRIEGKPVRQATARMLHIAASYAGDL